MPTIILIPFDYTAGVVPWPQKEHLEAGVSPCVVPPEPVYVPEPIPEPIPEPETITAEQADEIRRQYHLAQKAPALTPYEIEVNAYTEKAQRQHMGLSEPENKAKDILKKHFDWVWDSVDKDLAEQKAELARHKKEMTGEWVDPGPDPTMPKPKRKQKRAKRKAK